MKSIICPKCFSKHESAKSALGCAKPGCPRERIPTTVELSDSKQQANCASCGSVMKLRYCPDCGYLIQSEDENVDVLPISIIGGEGCGKSNYLSVLIDQIRHSMGKAYDCSLYPLGGDETIDQYERKYYKPLFVEGRCIDSTDQEDILPLVYSLVFSDTTRHGKTCNLTFYDACGANFQSERLMANYNRSIYNSCGVLFLIDPAQLPGLREHYRGISGRSCKEDASIVLSRTIRLIREGSGQKNIKKKISTPIAVCLTKADTFRPLLDAGSFLRYPSRHLKSPAFDMMDYNCCNLETRSLLEAWGGGDLIQQVTSQFSNCGFFSFAALGNAPDSRNQISHISPHRVCDPFLWIMRQNKAIKSNAG
ncbi:MAG: hypothetical protein FWH00_00630 [Oscillospiraceae bacterium]|nr:hypothetical protein [Oscillospiraceae bacterium]